MCTDLCACMCIVEVLLVCLCVCVFVYRCVFCHFLCLCKMCIQRGRISGVRSSVGRGSDVVKRPQRSGIGSRLCVSCSLQGSCLHADSHVFAMQKQRKGPKISPCVSVSCWCEKEAENESRIEAKSRMMLRFLMYSNQLRSERRWGGSLVWKSRCFPNIRCGLNLECTHFFSKLIHTQQLLAAPM